VSVAEYIEIIVDRNLRDVMTYVYRSHPTLNAYAIIPRGPDVMADLVMPHNRADL
jgi:glutathionyl-hydroquinone reductase